MNASPSERNFLNTLYPFIYMVTIDISNSLFFSITLLLNILHFKIFLSNYRYLNVIL